MRVTLQQFERGMLEYIDREFIDKAIGLKRFAMMTAVSIGAAKMELMLQNLPLIETDASGTFELDDVRDAAMESMDKMGGRIIQDVPMVGAVTFKAADIESIYEMVARS